MIMTFLSVCCTNIRTNSTYYLQHTTDWTELNVLLYDGTRVFTGLLLCA